MNIKIPANSNKSFLVNSVIVKFITDVNLGKLAKWLRILGYDTVFYPGNVDRDFQKRAVNESRVALTRKKNAVDLFPSGNFLIVESDHLHDQLKEVMDKLSFSPEPRRMFSICTTCNVALIEVCKEEIFSMVPDYIFASHNKFRMCPHCKGVFWPGTHIEKAQRYLKTHTQRHHP